MEWSVMEPIPTNTTHSFNFPFHPIWGISNGMEHINNIITILSSLFIPQFHLGARVSLIFFLISLFIPSPHLRQVSLCPLPLLLLLATLHSNKVIQNSDPKFLLLVVIIHLSYHLLLFLYPFLIFFFPNL